MHISSEDYYGHHPSHTLKRPLCLIGMMGSEANVVAYQLSSLTGLPLIELDAKVEHEAGCSLSALYERGGANAWRAAELRALKRALSNARPSIISLGDGALLSKEARGLWRGRAHLVYIERPLEELFERCLLARKDHPQRFPYWRAAPPSSAEALTPLLNARLEGYQEATLTLSAEARSALSVAQELLSTLPQLP
jgi:shikimate kinase